MSTKNEIPMALRTAYLAVHRRSEARFAKHGVTADQFVLLATLARGHALTQRELARRMSSDPSTVRAMLVLLENRGLVQRSAHSTDARARTVVLTGAGRRKFRQLWAAGDSIREQMFGALQPHEAHTLVGLLTRVADALNAESATTDDPPLIHRRRAGKGCSRPTYLRSNGVVNHRSAQRSGRVSSDVARSGSNTLDADKHRTDLHSVYSRR